jgi:CHAP domain
MSIADVMSRVTALQTLIGQSAAPAQIPATTTQTAAPTTFGDALSASTAGTDSSSTSASNENALLSLLEQSSAGQSLTDGLSSDDGGDDSSGFSLPALPSISDTLASALSTATPATTAPVADTTGTQSTGTGAQGVLSAAETQVGVTEQPPGSNDGPQISVYRDAVAGAAPGEPWCASFVSWAAAQAGEPLGPSGQGFDSVQDLTDWASSTGRLLPASSTPSPGDLILFGDRHVGIVEAVNTDGSLTTVEGNYANSVQYVQRSPSEATGYVRM